jgi:hypothetical protein
VALREDADCRGNSANSCRPSAPFCGASVQRSSFGERPLHTLNAYNRIQYEFSLVIAYGGIWFDEIFRAWESGEMPEVRRPESTNHGCEGEKRKCRLLNDYVDYHDQFSVAQRSSSRRFPFIFRGGQGFKNSSRDRLTRRASMPNQCIRRRFQS